MDVAYEPRSKGVGSSFFGHPGVKYYLRVVTHGSADNEEAPVCNPELCVYRPDEGLQKPKPRLDGVFSKTWNTGGSVEWQLAVRAVVGKFPE
jgi:hypothetical protein